MAVLFAAWTALSIGPVSGAEKSYAVPYPAPTPFRKVLVLFSADTTKKDRDEFLAGLEEVRLRHQNEYYETFRKWRESAPSEQETAESEAPEEEEDPFAGKDHPLLPAHELERLFHHNPYFLRSVNVMTIRTNEDLYPPFSPVAYKSRLRDMDPVVRMHDVTWEYEAVIVVASDTIAAEQQRLLREQTAVLQNETVYLFAGVSTFDESLREPQEGLQDLPENARARYSFAIRYAVDPWPNTDLALSIFPKTKKVILLTPEKLWNEKMETAYRSKLGPGKTLKIVSMPEIPKQDVTEADIREMKDKFIASVKAEIQPDTVIVSMSSVETGQDPVSWLPEKFDACPVFADTVPARPSSVGGFCRSMESLGIQVAELLDQLDEVPLPENKLPPSVLEDDDLWLNEAALKRYRLKASDFPGAILMNTNSNKAPRIRVYPSWSKKRIALLLAANAVVLFGVYLFALVSIRAARRKRLLSEKVYDSMPVRVLVTDREGRIIDYHMQFGEVEQKGEFLWKNINEVPWLRDIGADQVVREAFDSGKTLVREFEVDGEHRIVVLSSTPSDVFGRPAVIAVSSDSPSSKPQA